MSKEDITLARVEDISQIATFVYTVYKELELTVSPPDFDKIMNEVAEAVVQEGVLVRRNKEDDRKLDCVIMFDKTSSWWSTEPLLVQKFFFVKPEFRDGKLFNDLLSAAEDYAKIGGLKIIQDVIGKSFNLKGRLLKRHGYTPVGVSFLKDIT